MLARDRRELHAALNSEAAPQPAAASTSSAAPEEPAETIRQGHRQVAANLEEILELSLLRCGRTWLCMIVLLLCGMFAILLWSNIVYEKHKNDKCDQPLADMLRLIWVIIPIHAFKREIIQILLCFDFARDGPTEPWRVKIFKVLLLAVTFAWPVVAEVMVLNTNTCSEDLIDAVQAIVGYYALVVLVVVVLPGCYISCMLVLVRRGLIRLPRAPGACPENFIEEELVKVPFNSDLFDDSGNPGTYPSACSICLDEFSEERQISMTPCQPQPHIFHTDCLDGWGGHSRTCPLCRTDMVEARANSGRDPEAQR